MQDRLNYDFKFQLSYNYLRKRKIYLGTKLNDKCKGCVSNHHSTICNKSSISQNSHNQRLKNYYSFECKCNRTEPDE